jgi:hypothetical protein
LAIGGSVPAPAEALGLNNRSTGLVAPSPALAGDKYCLVVRSASQRRASVRCNLRLSAKHGKELAEETLMTMFVFAVLTVTAVIWAITAPQSPQDLTMDEISQLVVLGFVP